jgi:5-methylcytosine-specific restriction endonuclease McrA
VKLCSITGCPDLAKASRGWCWKHYNHWRRQGDPLARFIALACSIESCEKKSRVAGMCDTHYRRIRKYGDPSSRLVRQPKTCTKDACNRPSRSTGLCSEHYYQRWTEHGSGREVMAASSARRRALMAHASKVDKKLSWRTLWAAGCRSCYLCGQECNPADYRTITNVANRKQKIVGATHPTLDHVVALVRGGTHTRDNVDLACSRCNSRKHAKANYAEAQRSKS